MKHLYCAVCAGSDEIGSFSAIGILLLVSVSAISPQLTCHSVPLRSFIQIGPPSAEKNDVMSIFKMADLRHLGF